jgi:hypothetical protein
VPDRQLSRISPLYTWTWYRIISLLLECRTMELEIIADLVWDFASSFGSSPTETVHNLQFPTPELFLLTMYSKVRSRVLAGLIVLCGRRVSFLSPWH